MLLAEDQPIKVVVQTPGTPVWLTIVALTVSVFALVVSGLQYRSHRTEAARTHPMVTMTAIYTDRMIMGGGQMRKVVAVFIRNRGRESTRIVHFIVRGESVMLNGFVTINDEFESSGDGSGTRVDTKPTIEGFSTESFYIDASVATEEHLTVSATFGHGPTLTYPVELNKTEMNAEGERKRWLRRSKR